MRVKFQWLEGEGPKVTRRDTYYYKHKPAYEREEKKRVILPYNEHKYELEVQRVQGSSSHVRKGVR